MRVRVVFFFPNIKSVWLFGTTAKSNSSTYCIFKSTLPRIGVQYSIMDMDYTSVEYSGVVLTNNIRGNGRKKLLLIGKTGAGKSSVRF